MEVNENNNLSCPDWDLSPDLLSEGEGAYKPMNIISISKNMGECRVRMGITCKNRRQKKTLKQDISDMLRIMAYRNKYFKESKVKANSCDVAKESVNQEYFNNKNQFGEIKYVTMKEIPCISDV